MRNLNDLTSQKKIITNLFNEQVHKIIALQRQKKL